jgi:Na+(H+)/acetate symporter ActP
MKWLSLVLVILSTAAVVAVLGFSAFSVIMGIIGGLIASFAIAGYLQSISRDDPGDRYEHIR